MLPVSSLLLFFQLQAASEARQAKAAGVLAAQGGDYSRAALEFGRACQLDPKLADVCFYQGRALYYSNRFRDALAPLKRSQKAGEAGGRADSTIAQCFEALGQTREAEEEHKKAIANDPTGEYRIRYGVFLFRQGRIDEAAVPLSSALERDPQNFEANLQMGRVLFEQEKFASALVLLEKATMLQPKSTEAHILAAKVCQRLGRAAEAAKHMKAAQVPEP